MSLPRARRPAPLAASDWPPYPPPASYPLTPSAFPPPTAALVPEASELARAATFDPLSTTLRERRAQTAARTTRRVSASLAIPTAPRPANASLPTGEDDGADLSEEDGTYSYSYSYPRELLLAPSTPRSSRRAHSHEPQASSPLRLAHQASPGLTPHDRPLSPLHPHSHPGDQPAAQPASRVISPHAAGGTHAYASPAPAPTEVAVVSAALARLEAAVGRLIAEVGSIRSELGALRAEVEGMRREQA
jgi:hypothetical protein